MEESEPRDPSYEEDVYGWSQRQAALLREGRYDDVDVENVAEEIESMGRSQVSSLQSCYRLIAAHLLKVLFQPERFTRSWQGTILRERFNAAAYLKENPSLKPRRPEIFAEAYAQARLGRDRALDEGVSGRAAVHLGAGVERRLSALVGLAEPGA